MTDATTPAPTPASTVDTLTALDQAYNRMLDILSSILKVRRYDLSPNRALMLVRMPPDTRLTVGEVAHTCFFGMNVSYNVTKLVEAGLLAREDDTLDARRAMLSLTEEGARVRMDLIEILESVPIDPAEGVATPVQIDRLGGHLSRLEMVDRRAARVA